MKWQKMYQKTIIFAIRMLRQRMPSITLALAAMAVSLALLCNCSDRKEMSNRVIVQNELFTITGDSVIEGRFYACAPKPDRIESNISVSYLDSLYRQVDTTRVRFVQGKPWRMHKSRPAMIPAYKSKQPLIDALYKMSSDFVADAVDKSGRFAPSQNNYSRLGLTARGKDADKFWFSLFHELAHIILGHIGQVNGTTEDDELGADAWARDTLIPMEVFDDFRDKSNYSATSICKFAKQQGIAPGIVVGRLQNEGCIKHSMLNDLKERYEIAI